MCTRKKGSKRNQKKKEKVKKFKCEQCLYATNRRADLCRHVKAVHSLREKECDRKFRKFAVLSSDINEIFSEIERVLNDAPGDQAVDICGRRMLTIRPKMNAMMEYLGKHKNETSLKDIYDKIKSKADVIANRISELLVHFASIPDEKQLEDRATCDEDTIEVVDLGIIKVTFIIDTNVFMHFPTEIDHIFENRNIDLALSYTVLTELDGLKKSKNQRTSALASAAQKKVQNFWNRFKYNI